MDSKFTSTRDIIIHTSEFDAAVHFYREILGLAVTMQSDDLVGFETGSFQLFVDRKGPSGSGSVFEFCVADVEGAKQKLLKAGCAVVAEDPSLPRCYIRDPHGLVFNPTEES